MVTVQRLAVGDDQRAFHAARLLTEKMPEMPKNDGIWLVGTADETTQSLFDLDLKGPIGIVMGAEGPGMRRLTGEHCDFLAKIPMAGRVECLNVSVATGVCLFECVRQRGLKKA